METTHTAVSEKLVIVASEHKEEEEFWLKKLAGPLVKSSFPFDFRKNEGGRRKENIRFGTSD